MSTEKELKILAELASMGAESTSIIRNCKFQNVRDKNVFSYCKQVRNADYSWNLGSAGGPVISCMGAPPRSIGSHKEGDVIVIDYADKAEPCPYYIEGEVLGWKILLPRSVEDESENITEISKIV